MMKIRRSFRLRTFLTFVTYIVAMYFVNYLLAAFFARIEIRNIYEKNLLSIHQKWLSEDDINTSPAALKSALLDTILIAKSEDVLLFVTTHDSVNATATAKKFPEDYLPGLVLARSTRAQSAKHIQQATVLTKGETWEMTEVITPTRTIVSAVNKIANERIYDELLAIRHQTIKVVAPIVLMIGILISWLMTSKMLAPTRKIQAALQNLDSRDLSSRVSSESEDREFVEFIDVFNNMLAKLEKNFLQASRFSSDAAHELRTPLTIIQGHVERVIYESEPGSRVQMQLTLVADEIQRLTSITQKLLLLSQADAGRLQLDLERLNVSDVMDELASDAQMFESQLRITSKIEKKIFFETDKNLFQQLLNNLLTNALKYNLPNGWIHIALSAQDGQLKLRFSNPSLPISSAAKEQVFERFYRVDSSHNREVDGTGLGLSLCREIALANVGKLSFEVDEANEVTVEFTAPLKRAA